MKIIHVILFGYREGYGYQENILPVKHRELGYEVGIIAFDHFNYYKDLVADSRGIKTYVSDYGIKVTILPSNNTLLRKLPLWVFSSCIDTTSYLFETLSLEEPDVIFIHGIPKPDYEKIIKYKKQHPDVKVYVDNHADFYNTPIKTFAQFISRKIIGRYYVRRLAAVSEKVWGVSPWRVEFLKDVYGLEPPKTGLLVMGGDEKYIHWEQRAKIRDDFRTKHSIPQNAFVVITGGKIDKTKNIHLLIDAVKSINNLKLYLIVFGNYSDDMNEYENETNKRIINLGWLASNDVYDVFLASDLCAFPGTHSVLWEQACASGVPCLFKDWGGGFSHVDLGGNCILLKDITKDTLAQTIERVMEDNNLYARMCNLAENKCRKNFSYLEIAKKSIEIN